MGDAPKEIKIRHIGNLPEGRYPAYGQGVAAALKIPISEVPADSETASRSCAITGAVGRPRSWAGSAVLFGEQSFSGPALHLWDIKYHLIWITKYRYKVLRGGVAERRPHLAKTDRRDIRPSRATNSLRQAAG